MSKHETIEQNRQGWNTISASYQAERRISTDDVHYGPMAPGERELGLLGDVSGKKVLEVGCGGGQNSIALTRWGATCTGVDPSSAQLAHARKLADAHDVKVQFVTGVAKDLGRFPDGAFDIVLSSYAFDYVPDLRGAYAEAWRVLRPEGLFVFCLSHPWFQAVGWHLIGDPDAPHVGNYGAWPLMDEWDWTFEDGTSARLRDHLRTMEEIINDLIEAGFSLEKLVEQKYENAMGASPEELARFPYLDSLDAELPEYEIARKLPRTLIIRARKVGGASSKK